MQTGVIYEYPCQGKTRELQIATGALVLLLLALYVAVSRRRKPVEGQWRRRVGIALGLGVIILGTMLLASVLAPEGARICPQIDSARAAGTLPAVTGTVAEFAPIGNGRNWEYSVSGTWFTYEPQQWARGDLRKGARVSVEYVHHDGRKTIVRITSLP